MIYAIIPARGGSKGVPRKNLLPLGGYPLVAYSIAAARLAGRIDRVLVSTDSEEIAAVARQFGAEVPFLRPAELSGDTAGDAGVMSHALEWFRGNSVPLPEYLVHLRPTTPLRRPALLDEAVKLLMSHPEATSLRSAHEAPETPFKWFRLEETGFFTGIFPGYTNDELNKPRQAFPQAYIPDGYVDMIDTGSFEKTGLLHGPSLLAFVSPPCREIDTPEDFNYLEFELKRSGSELLDHLRKEFPL